MYAPYAPRICHPRGGTSHDGGGTQTVPSSGRILRSYGIKAFLNGGRADLLHNLIKASFFDEGELENGVAGPKGLSDDEMIAIRLYTTLRVMRRQVSNVLSDFK